MEQSDHVRPGGRGGSPAAAKPRFTVDAAALLSETGPSYRDLGCPPPTGRSTRRDARPRRLEATIVAADDKRARERIRSPSAHWPMRSLAPLATVRADAATRVRHAARTTVRLPDELRLFAASAMSRRDDSLRAIGGVGRHPVVVSGYQEQVDSIENSLDSAALLDLVLGSQRGPRRNSPPPSR